MTFTPLTPSDFKTLRPFFQKQLYELCEYSLVSILAWQDEDYMPHGLVNGDSLIVRADFNSEETRQYLLLPLSPEKAFPPVALQDLAIDLGVDEYSFVPEQYIHQYGRSQVESFFHISEQPAHADYIYLTEDLAQLKGNKYSKKRNLINQFDRRYVSKGRVSLSPITPEVSDECVDFLEKWCEANDCDADQMDALACEKQAIINTFESLEALEVSGLLLRIDGVVCAFGVGARLTEQMGVLHFEKAFADIKGLYQYFDNQCAKHLFKGCKYLNKENDMGNPGLAKAKKSYHPVKILKSYQLTVR